MRLPTTERHGRVAQRISRESEAVRKRAPETLPPPLALSPSAHPSRRLAPVTNKEGQRQ